MNLQSHFQHTKYIETYFKIIFRAQSENRKRHKKNHPNYVYYENHHILPKSIWPEHKDLKMHPCNGVLLTAKEHFICHLLLWKHYKKTNEIRELSKMAWAFQQMQMNRGIKIKSSMYESLKLDLSHSDEARAKMSANRKGKPKSPATRAKMSANRKGKPKSPEARAKQSESMKGKNTGPKSPETRAKMKERRRSPETRAKQSETMKAQAKIKCEHCGAECSPHMYSRWHGNNCKRRV